MKKTVSLLLFLAIFVFGNDFQKGIELYDKGEYKNSIKFFENSANSGHIRAQTILGHIYKRGKEVEVDYDKAIYWYSLAANEKDIIAQYFLGEIYELKKDYKKAYFWYKEASIQGASRAQYKLGVLYQNGLGVKKDEEKAYKLFKLTSKNRVYEAKVALEEMCRKIPSLCK